tara:strand:+ start:2843 stop:3163 length:321 start_codon:yes stop_codon:yes gene_type:complete
MSEETKTTEQELENAVNEEEAHANEMLAMAVSRDNPLKEMLVEYVGTKFDQEDVTVNMIAEAMAHEFPEFVYAFAEENFLRGYQLGLDDAYKTIAGVPEETTAEKL